MPRRLRLSGPLREAAEPALEGADVRVVDVAVADPGDLVADDAAAQLVGDLGDGADLAAAGREQVDELVLAGLLAGERRRRAPRGRGRVAHGRGCGTSVGGSTLAPAVPRRVAPADLHDLGAGAGVDGGLDALGEARRRGRRGRGPRRRTRSSTAKRTPSSSQRSGSSANSRVDGEAGRQLEAGGLGGGAAARRAPATAARG